MKPYADRNEELIRKYRVAGKIRIISFSLLLFFLLLMKSIGGYPYLNVALISLIVVEVLLNQPYHFIVQRVNTTRFQYYQMATDIIAISWILYYMGGIEAPIVNLAYCAVILWAGVVSTVPAVFFAVGLSAALFSLIIVLEYCGFLPFIAYYNYHTPTAQMLSILMGNVSFFFAFGYFSAHASGVIKFMERKRYEDSLKYTHRFLATGYLIGYIAHDASNHAANISGYAKLLSEKECPSVDAEEAIKSIGVLAQKATDLLSRLMRFAQTPSLKLEPVSIHGVIEDALDLTYPLVRYSKMAVEKRFDPGIPLVMGERGRLQEVFVTLILNALEAMPGKGTLTITTALAGEIDGVRIVVSDSGIGITPENVNRIRAGESFFTATQPKGKLGLGLVTAYEIVNKHKGKIDLESTIGKGTTFVIQFPAAQKEAGL